MLAVVTDAYAGVHQLGCVYPPADPAAIPAQADLARGAGALGLVLTCSTFTGTTDAAGTTMTGTYTLTQGTTFTQNTAMTFRKQ